MNKRPRHKNWAFECPVEERLAIMVANDERMENENDSILSSEIPTSLSSSGWMRNQREAFEFLHPNRDSQWIERRANWQSVA